MSVLGFVVVMKIVVSISSFDRLRASPLDTEDMPPPSLARKATLNLSPLTLYSFNVWPDTHFFEREQEACEQIGLMDQEAHD